MAENSKIAWTTHTFNHVRGCTKVAAGCTNCYADAQSKRNPSVLGIWGPNGSRVIASEDMWKKPLKWNREAQCNCGAAGMGDKQCKWCEGGCERPRVFCASLSDVFEEWDGQVTNSAGLKMYTCPVCGHIATVNQIPGEFWEQGVDDQHREIYFCPAHPMDGGPVVVNPTTLDHVRARLFRLIDTTPNLDWLLLTKRPENILKMWPHHAVAIVGEAREPVVFPSGRSNIWLGTSVAEQADADRNIPLLLQCRDLSPVLFVSAEPLIGPVDFTLSGATIEDWDEDWKYNVLSGHEFSSPRDDSDPKSDKIDWVIAGGESGHHARACNVDWIREIVQQCKAARTACFVKQLGSQPRPGPKPSDAMVRFIRDTKGGDIDEFPEDLRVREFPKTSKE